VASTRDDAAAISAALTELRRAIHREPEIGLDLPRTQAKVLSALAGLPLEVTCGEALTSVTAVLRGSQPGATVLLRGDMDALPVTEHTRLPYASQIGGTMHACGHDLHTAMLAGAARLLSQRQAELAGNVIFMFQPGEEGCGGAEKMIAEGVLDAAGKRPVAAYGLHVVSSLLPAGMCTSRPGTMMAAADTLEVTVRGRGGHAAQPHHAADPIPVACELVTALQTMVTRQFDVFDPVVLTVGLFQGGTVSNVIPDEAFFAATVRTFSAAARADVKVAALRLVRGRAMPEAEGQAYSWLANLDRMEDRRIPAWVTETAHEAAEIAFGLNDLDTARWASDIGHLSNRDSEIPLCDLLLVAQASGNVEIAQALAWQILEVNSATVPEECAPRIFEIIHRVFPAGLRPVTT